MDDLDFDCCVADYGYGKDRVAYLVSRFPGRVYGCFYQEDSKLIIPAFSDAGFKVSVDRTASLQTLTNAIRNREFIFPTYDNDPLMATVSKHLQAGLMKITLQRYTSNG